VSHGVCRWANLAVKTGTGVKMCKPKCRALLINEVAAGKNNGEDWIELYATENVDLKDYRLSDVNGDDQGSTILASKSTIMAAGTYRVFYADNIQLKFKLDKEGETIYLAYAADSNVVVDSLTYGNGDVLHNGAAFGPYPGGAAGGESVRLSGTPGAPNKRA